MPDNLEPAQRDNLTTPRYTENELRVHISRAVAAAVERERERCAKICEATYPEMFDGRTHTMPCFDTPEECAAAIRKG
jgi:hypothetical protein